MKEIVLNVEGMSCQHCVASITTAIKDLATDALVNVDLANKVVTATVPENISVDAVKEAIEDVGYDVVA